jgi:1-acyl-sn-glycerol-3-phosphate acyltransferase
VLKVIAGRILSISIVIVATFLAIALAPVWVPSAWLVDRTSTQKRCALRCGIFLCFYLRCEIQGLLGIAWATLLGALKGELYTEADANRLFHLQCWWGSSLLHGGARILGFEIRATGEEALDGRPMILMIRHASSADTVLASEFVSSRRGIRLRYVLKHELLWDPCLDFVGTRTTNYFVRRGSGDPGLEVAGIARLLEDLDAPRGAPGIAAGDGILIYPEGTRFSPEKRTRAMERLRRDKDPHVLARAERLHSVLPPRLSGTLTLLQGNPNRDVVICSHVGFDRAASFWDLWNGALLGAVVKIHFKRIPYEAIPTERNQLVDWLFDEWEEVDAYVSSEGESISAAAR